jgi:hypothetical protein
MPFARLSIGSSASGGFITDRFRVSASGEIRAGIGSRDLLYAVANLCLPVADEGVAYSQRMVALLIDGLRYGAELQRS